MREVNEYGNENIGVKDFPPFVRVSLRRNARNRIFSDAMKKVGTIEREYENEDYFLKLYGKRKGEIVKLLSEGPKSAQELVESSKLSPSAVYHFLNDLRKKGRVTKKGKSYSLEGNSGPSSLADIVRVEEDSSLRRKYGISVKELEIAYFLWDRFLEVAPQEREYARTYQNRYTLADAVHRWRTGRTDIPVWALSKLIELSGRPPLDGGGISQYHVPPGIPVKPYYQDEYKLPIRVDSNLDKIVVQLLQKMSKNHLYTFPKKRKWLFENLHRSFGEFDDKSCRIPSAITEIVKAYYKVETLNRSLAHIPLRMRNRWADLSPLHQIMEESSLLLHVISLSSRSNGGIEITSRSPSFLQDISHLSSNLGLGALTVHKKHRRPHFRAYLSENKVDILRRYAHLFEVYPDVEIWMRIPLNRIGEKLVLEDGGSETVERICREELVRFVESILKSLERKKREFSSGVRFLQYKEEISDYFWEQKLIPSPMRVEEIVEMKTEENALYA